MCVCPNAFALPGHHQAHLFSAFEGGFEVWETRSWASETFDFPGSCLAAAWADGRVAIVMDGVEAGDRVWVGCGGETEWLPASVLSHSHDTSDQGLVKLAIDSETGDPGPCEEWHREAVFADKPVFFGSLRLNPPGCAD